MPADDDDPARDWFERMPTVLDGHPRPPPEPDTAPHRSLDYLGGREAGYTEGVDLTIKAFIDLSRRVGADPKATQEVAARARATALSRG